MKPKLRRQWERGKQKVLARLAPLIGGTEPKQVGLPEFSGPRPTYEMAGRTHAVACGGISASHHLVRQIGLPEQIDSELHVLKRPRPYQDSDHVLNIAYNLLCGGHVLDDIEVRRNDATFLTPCPFCQRDVRHLSDPSLLEMGEKAVTTWIPRFQLTAARARKSRRRPSGGDSAVSTRAAS